ncbi:MAG: hypothetical protein ACTSRL_22760 [Candidatus Helarchaeota archaeon]
MKIKEFKKGGVGFVDYQRKENPLDPFMTFRSQGYGPYTDCMNLYGSYTGPKYQSSGVGLTNWDLYPKMEWHLNPLVGIGRNKDPKMNWYEAICLAYLQHNPLWYGFLWPKEYMLMDYIKAYPTAKDSWTRLKSINNFIQYGGIDPFGQTSPASSLKYLILKAGEDYVQLRCSDIFVPDFQAFAPNKSDTRELVVIDRYTLLERTQDGPVVYLMKAEDKWEKQLTNSIRRKRLIMMALTWVLPALYWGFKDQIDDFFVNTLSTLGKIPWVNKMFGFAQDLSGPLTGAVGWIAKFLPADIGGKVDSVRLKIDADYRNDLFGNATTPMQLLANLITERGIPWFLDRILGIDLSLSNMIINLLATPGETEFFNKAEGMIGTFQEKYQLMDKYVDQLMQVVEMFLTIFGQKEKAIEIQKTASEIWETFSHFFNQIVETASSFLEQTKTHIGQMAGSNTVPAIESALYSGNMDSMIGLIGNLPIQLIDKYTGGAIRAIFRIDVIKYGLGLLFAIIEFAMEGFDFQGLLTELSEGFAALGINFKVGSLDLGSLGKVSDEVTGKSPFTSIIFRELRGAFISMGMKDITLDGLFQYFIELCHMNFFPLEQIFNILWTITKMVIKVYVGGIFCTVLKRLINGIIAALLKHFITQIFAQCFPQIAVFGLGTDTVADLGSFTAEKVAGRMTSV